MSKRRHEDNDFVNVLRQKHKEDPLLKQEAGKNTFLLLMNAQRKNKNNSSNDHNMDESVCKQCQRGKKINRCHFCEKGMCHDCLQECIGCLESYCGNCSIIDYSQAYERVFCLTCKNG